MTAAVESQEIMGKVIRYEAGRGYGFIAPDRGGEDVFVHASDLEATKMPITCGIRVAFKVVDGGRGPKAYDVRIPASAAAVSPVASPAEPSQVSDQAAGDLCEVLSERQFQQEATEVLLRVAPTVTAEQILQIRDGFYDLARKYRWAD
jgi:cold shock CspA family protein